MKTAVRFLAAIHTGSHPAYTGSLTVGFAVRIFTVQVSVGSLSIRRLRYWLGHISNLCAYRYATRLFRLPASAADAGVSTVALPVNR